MILDGAARGRSRIVRKIWPTALLASVALAIALPSTTAAASPSGTPAVPGGGGHAQAGAVPGTAAPRVASAAVTSPGPRGIDIASYQHPKSAKYPNGAPINWPSVAASGVQFAYIKATEGTGYVNPYYAGDQQGAKAAGLYVGSYAFARLDANNPAAQADYLLQHAPYNSDGRTLPPMIDLESPDVGGYNSCWNLTPAKMVAWISTFVSTVQQRTGVRPLIYTGYYWWNQCTGSSRAFAAYPLDIAFWSSSQPIMPAGWSNYTVWQYTDGASIPGIQGAVDADVFRGSSAALKAWATPDRNIRLAADVTGDGSADLIADYGSSTDVMASTGAGFATPAVWQNAPFYGSVATLAADVTGGGTADLIAVNGTNTYVMASTGSAFGTPTRWSSVAFYGSVATLAADVTGDGMADLVAVNRSSVWVMASTGSGFAAPRLWSTSLLPGSRATLVADVTGDHKADLVFVGDTGVSVMQSTGNSFSDPRAWSAGPFYGSRATLAGDVNGDGQADLIAVNGTNVWVTTSTGQAFSTPQSWSGTAFYGARTTLSGDVNGDGRADLIAINQASTWAMESGGAGNFAAPTQWSSAFF